MIPAKLAAARVLISRKEAYYSAALWKLQLRVIDPWPVGAPGEICTTDKGIVLVSPDLVARASAEELAGCLVHELGHILRHHAARMGGRDHAAWNKAGDRAINPDVLTSWPLPYDRKNICMPEQVGKSPGLTAEEYYEEPEEGEGGDEKGERDPTGRIILVKKACGTCAGNKHPAEDGLTPEPGEGEMTKEDWEATATQVAHAVREHAKTTGKVPGGLARWANVQLEAPKADWRRIMAMEVRAALRASGAHDYTYSRPSRRQCAVILPSLRAPVIRASVVVDTSGSMGDEELAGMLEEVGGILKAAGSREVRFLSVDAQVHSDKLITSASQAAQLLKGGGGTDMGVGITAACRGDKRGKPDVIVVLSDAYSPWPSEKPRGVKVIIGLPEGGPETPAWARRVEIPR